MTNSASTIEYSDKQIHAIYHESNLSLSEKIMWMKDLRRELEIENCNQSKRSNDRNKIQTINLPYLAGELADALY